MNNDKTPFGMIVNIVLNDNRLSFKAKGLYSYLHSKKVGVHSSIDAISQKTKDGRLAVNSGLKELELFNYLERDKLVSGKMRYNLLWPDTPKVLNTSHVLKTNIRRKQGTNVLIIAA